MGSSRFTPFGGALSLVLAAGAAVGCNLDKLINTPTGRLEVSPSLFSDSAAIGSRAARATTLTVERSGAVTMSWSATRAHGSAWLSLTPTSGAAPGSVTLSATAAALSTGTHRDTIVLTSTNGDQAPVRIPVVFVVKPCDILPIAPDTLIAARLSAADCTPPLGPGRFGRVYRLTGSAGDSLSLAMTASTMGARVVLDSAPPGAAPPLAESTSCDGNPLGGACVWYLRLPRPGSFWVEATTTDSLQTGDFSLSVTRPRPPDAPESARQLRSDTTDAITPGAPIAERNVVLQATLRDPDAGDRLRLEAEVKPLSAPFNGSGTVFGNPTGNAQPAYARVTGLADGTSYHWRARAVDQTGRAGAWIAYGADEEAPDFRVAQVATQLRFTSEPATATAGAPMAPAVRVTAFDAQGEIAANFTGRITLAIATNPAGGTLSGTGTTSASQGAATFSDLVIDRPGAGYSLIAASPGIPATTSAAFVVLPATANRLVFTVQPANSTAGAALTPAVRVAAQDALGNVATGYTGSVTVTIGTNPGGATLAGTTSVAAVSGIATFPGLSLNRTGSGYLLAVSAAGLASATSSAFNIVHGAAAAMVFAVQPTTAIVATTIAPAVKVNVQDALGNLATGFTGNVTVAIGTNPGGATLAGTRTTAAAGGVATFSTLSLNRVGSGYTLTAAATGLPGSTSSGFNVVAGSGNRLVFTTQPTSAAAGASLPAVRVSVQDVVGNVVTSFTGTVTASISNNAGTGTLSGTVAVAAAAGVATFSTLSINRSGTGYTLAATAGGVTSATSAAFNITPGPASQLVFSVQPVATAAGAAITPAVRVAAQDALGNVVSGFTSNVTVAISANPGGGALSGTSTVAAVAGTATFAGLSINKTGAGYTLIAAAVGLSSSASAAFAITAAPAASLFFTVQPSDEIAGAVMTPAVQVTARDALGNIATGFTANVTVAIGTNPGSGTLAGTRTIAAAAGVATFSTLSINRTGTGYTLTGAATGLTGVTSTAFNITPGAATVLVFTVQPSNTPVNSSITPPVQVTGRDSLGNVATGFTGTITVVEGVDGSALNNATLSGTTAVAAVAGVATFSTLRINQAGTGYTLKAGFGAQPPVAESSTFKVTAP